MKRAGRQAGSSAAGAPMQVAKAEPQAKQLRKQAGTWLKELRARAGLSQIELAEILGFKYYTFISQVENGFGRVPTESLEAWARALGVEPSAFARELSVLLRSGAAPAAVRGEEMNVVKFPRVTHQLPKAGRRPSCSSSWRLLRRCDRGRRGERLGGRRHRARRPAGLSCSARRRTTTASCASRVSAGIYVIEDGAGRVLFEHDNPDAAGRTGRCRAAPPQGGHCRACRGGLVRAARGCSRRRPRR